MKVLYSFPHALGAPGIGTTAWHHVVGLARAGAEVSVACTSVRRPLPEDVSVRVVTSLGPVRHRMVGLDRAYRWHDRVAAIAVRRTRPDVVHCWPRAVLHTVAAAQKARAIAVREAPSPYTPVALEQAQQAWAELGLQPPAGHFHAANPAVIALEDREFAAVDAVLVGSAAAAATFGRATFDVTVKVNGYGFDPARFQTPAEPATTPPTVVFVGRCEPGKGIHTLLRAWAEVDSGLGARLMLCGAIPDSVAARLKTELEDPSITMLGHVSDVPAVLESAAILAHPSFSEGSALAVYEAMGSGLIPLVSEASGSPVTDGVDGLVHRTGDARQLAEHLRAVLSSPGELARLRAGVAASRSTLTWDAAGQRLLAVYQTLAGQNAF